MAAGGLRSFAAHRRRWVGPAVVVVGIFVGQAILYGPSLVGQRILLPLDILAAPGVYIPRADAKADVAPPHDKVFVDLVFLIEPSRRFAVSEVQAGRWPLWAPYEYAGCPFVEYPKYSPFAVLSYLFVSPVVVAWSQVALAMVAGSGAYLFCRRVLGVGYWPAAIAAWCWPLTGSFVFWQGYHIATAIGWLPWVLLAVDATVRKATRWSVPGLAAATGVTVLSAHLDMAGQVLLASGLYAAWCLGDHYGRQVFGRRSARSILALVAGWGLGLLLAAPQVLPMFDYALTGSRMLRRSEGSEERPPVGPAALPQIVLPDMYGSSQLGSFPMYPEGEPNLNESSSAAFAGLLATLVAAPLAWSSRRHRSANLFWMIFGFFTLSWCLNVPGLVALLRLPGLKMMSHNRFVFGTSWAIVAMAAIGLDVLLQKELPRRWWFWLPAAVLAGLLGWCAYRWLVLPEPLRTMLPRFIRGGGRFPGVGGIRNLADVHRAQATFTRSYGVAMALCLVGTGAWLVLWFRGKWRAWLVPLLGGLWLAEMLWFAYGRSAQCDPALYYPSLPVLEQLTRAPPGRMLGCACLPATVSSMAGAREVRGYDSVDPARLVQLLGLAAEPGVAKPEYAEVQWFVPRVADGPPREIRLPPVLDMLNVRYVVFRGSPPPKIVPAFSAPDYFAMVNTQALPRVFVPRRVETETDDAARLEKLGAPDFDPRQVAYVESAIELPGPASGRGDIVDEIPTRIVVSLHMDTPGLVVLSDLWDNGWRAYLDGQPVPILRTNHALRGVVAPAGEGTLEFRYETQTVVWGWRLMGLAMLALVGCAALPRFGRRGRGDNPPKTRE
jgi:hypothetical protein